MITKPHILIVDDDPQIGDLLQDYLQKHGFRVTTARNGEQMRREIKKSEIDLVILDLMLPGEDGVTLCRRLRESSNVFIIMLSAAGEETDRIIGLEVGADDYLAKPFNPRELLARIKALLRRTQLGRPATIAKLPFIQFDEWILDRNRRCLIDKDGLIVSLSSGEYDLLLAFIEHPQRILNRDQLMDLTRGREATPYDRSIDVQVGRLRKKIEKDPKNPQILLTMRGGGYQLDVSVQVLDK